MNAHDEDSRQTVLHASKGRDAGKRFKINEVNPVLMAGFVLRLLAALRLAQTDDLMDLFRSGENTGSDLQAILRILTGCDPVAVHALISDALTHIEVAPDVQHPGTFRPCTAVDIREMATLGDLLGAFARVNLLPG